MRRLITGPFAPITATTVSVRMSAVGLGRVKTKSDLVVVPSGRQIFAFFYSPRDRRAQNSGVRLYRVEFSHSQGQQRRFGDVRLRSA
jgi:hypothetical protein